MATTATRHLTTKLDLHSDRSTKPKQDRTDIWTSLLKQTQVAQSRNRSNAVVHKDIVICGGSPEDQRAFLASLIRPSPSEPWRKARNEKPDQKEKGSLALSNRYAYGYGHFSLFSAQQSGIGTSTLGTESEEVARLQCHCIPEASVTYDRVLARILSKSSDGIDRTTADHNGDKITEYESTHQLSVQILLSWTEPWNFLRQIRAWLQLLVRAVAPNEDAHDENVMATLKDHEIPITVIVQHVEAQQELEQEGWTEETFDHICQTLRTVLLPLHPYSALIYTPSLTSPQQPGSPLSELQKMVFSALDLNTVALSPRPPSSGTHNSASAKTEDLLPKHNVVDRMNIVIPRAWDSTGKVRLLSETFSPEEVLSAWVHDMSSSMFPAHALQAAPIENTVSVPSERPTRQTEEVFSAEPSSPVSSIPSLPPSPTKRFPSAISMFETQIVDPNAHKAPKPAAITVIARPEQEFLQEMKVELDSYNAKDREKNMNSPVSNRIVGIPTGESTGALDSLGDVSFNIGGVSYNSTSAEAAIERLKRPHAPGVHDASSQVSSSRSGTPRQPRRAEQDRETPPGVTTPSSNRADFPSEDLEKYFASLAKKAGGVESRQATPSRQ